MVTTPVPPLEFAQPPCPLCEHEVGYDGTSYWCEHCGATWGEEGMTGEVAAPARCRSTIDAYEHASHEVLRGRAYRCVLPDGHDADRDPYRDPPIEHRGTRTDPAAPPLTVSASLVPGLVWSWVDKDRGVALAPLEHAAAGAS